MSNKTLLNVMNVLTIILLVMTIPIWLPFVALIVLWFWIDNLRRGPEFI